MTYWEESEVATHHILYDMEFRAFLLRDRLIDTFRYFIRALPKDTTVKVKKIDYPKT